MSELEPLAAVVGYGRTAFGEHWDKDFEELLVEAGVRTFDSVDKGLERGEIESCCFGGTLVQAVSKTGLMEAYMSRELGLHVPMSMSGGGSSSGSSALHEGIRQVLEGKDVVLVGGIEKMTDRIEKMPDDLMFDSDRSEFYSGFTAQSLVATMMNRYIRDFARHEREACRRGFAKVASKNHQHAVNNQLAQYPRGLPVEVVMNSDLVADPLRVFECAPHSDGAASVILTSPEKAEEFTDEPVWIVASEKSTDSVDLGYRDYMNGVPATAMALEKAFKRCGVTMEDVQLAEVHDSYTPHEIFFLEDSGFVERGEGWRLLADLQWDGGHVPYESEDNGSLVVNAGGGLKADGNPLGATGVRQACEVALQLRFEAGERQVDLEGNGLALTHNLGGTGGICNVHLFARDVN